MEGAHGCWEYTPRMHTYDYPRPALTADVVAVRGPAAAREILLIRRRFDPFAGRWALPGGFVDEWELPESAARREFAEETGIAWDGPLVLAGVFGKKGRDPRGWNVTAAYVAIIDDPDVELRPADDAVEAAWFPVDRLPALAFDHDEVIATALGVL